MRDFILSCALIIMLLLSSVVFGRDKTIYDQAKAQCLDRFDKEKCLAYFDDVLGQKTEKQEALIEESFARKEARYSDLQRKDGMSSFFREEFDYASRRIDAVKQKALRGTELQAKRKLSVNKEAARVILDDYNQFTEKVQCNGLDTEECLQVHGALQETKRKYFSEVIEGLNNGLIAMLAYAQRSPFVTESTVAILSSDINQYLAQTRLLRSRIRTNDLTVKDIADVTTLLQNGRVINAHISLLHIYGQLHSLSRLLSVMHIRWERKAMHLFATEHAEDLEATLSLISSSLDYTTEELQEAAGLLSLFEHQQTRTIMSHLSRAYTSLLSAAEEQKKMHQWVQRKEIPFTQPYDLLEEAVDNRIHGMALDTKESITEPQISAKLYPERGQTIVTLSYEPFERYVFSTVNEEQLVHLIAKKLQQDEESVKLQLRFELGGK